ncbi:MAG: nicotinate-nucleotide adenylyltransferase [Deltaproteobacteria bacterium]|nr:nicotinate-nucleotide adenylyltransferase [Deltaproteobacteria bacterium]
MRLAVIGGTFNPIHYGHLRVAEEVRESLGLDKILFIPTFIPPHKTDEPMTPPKTRLDMARLAVSDNPGFEVSDIEIKRGGKSYTIDTVRALKSGAGEDLKVFLIIGSDSFNDITTWCEYRELFRLSSFVVVERPGYPVKTPGEVLPVELARKFWYDASAGVFMNSDGNTITYLQTTLIDVSSSEIRRKVREGRSVRYLLPGQVMDYIYGQKLYR